MSAVEITYWQDLLAFRALGKGGAVKVYGIAVGEEHETALSTGILLTRLAQTDGDEWRDFVSLDGEQFPSLAAALDAWSSRGRPS